MRKTVCIDLDGVLARHEKWQGLDHFGEPLPDAVELTKRIAEFADVVIYTCRCNPELGRGVGVSLLVGQVRAWLDQHGFVYHDIYAGVGKPIAAAYIDDRAIAYQPQDGGSALWCIAEAQQLCGVPLGRVKDTTVSDDNPLRDFHSVPEAVKRYFPPGTSPFSVRRWISKGVGRPEKTKLPARRVGGRYFLCEKEITAFLEAVNAGPGARRRRATQRCEGDSA